MNVFRRLSTARLLVLIGIVVAAGIAAGAIAVAASGGGGTTPPAKPLAQALHDAATAPAPAGITARVSFTNNLFGSGSLLGDAGPALVSGATGRLWATNDGRGRVELQSDAGDTQIVWSPARVTVYDASSNTVYELARSAPSQQRSHAATPPTLADIGGWLGKLAAHANVSGAQPDNVAGRPAYTVSVSPKGSGGLLGAAQLSWDAAHGVPLRIAVIAKGSSVPVLELKATDISFGAVASSDVDVAPPAGAKVVALSGLGHGNGASHAKPATGLDGVRLAVPFALVAPASVDGRPLTSARTAGEGALLTYGDGLGALVVYESASGGGTGSTPGPLGSPGPLGALPEVTVGAVSARKLQTPLGTVLAFDSNGVRFLVGGSLPGADVEAAARAFA